MNTLYYWLSWYRRNESWEKKKRRYRKNQKKFRKMLGYSLARK